MKASFVIKGALTYVLPRSAYSRKSGGSGSARYCYSVFMRHLVRLNQAMKFTVPETVAELGPGDSLGIGLCALLSGAEKYVGLDVVKFTDLSGNLSILDELVELFQAQAPIPDDQEFPRVRPKLDDYAFPSTILDKTVLKRSLSQERIANLREQLSNSGGDRIAYVAPWSAGEMIEESSIDWIFSQAVLEHVDDLEGAYQAFSAWLKPNGVMSHQIDFKCHNMAATWNGHWAAPDWLWRLTRGRRPYLLNRQPLSVHQAMAKKSYLTEIDIKRVEQGDGLTRNQLPCWYRELPDEDLVTSGAFIVSQKST